MLYTSFLFFNTTSCSSKNSNFTPQYNHLLPYLSMYQKTSPTVLETNKFLIDEENKLQRILLKLHTCHPHHLSLSIFIMQIRNPRSTVLEKFPKFVLPQNIVAVSPISAQIVLCNVQCHSVTFNAAPPNRNVAYCVVLSRLDGRLFSSLVLLWLALRIPSNSIHATCSMYTPTIHEFLHSTLQWRVGTFRRSILRIFLLSLWRTHFILATATSMDICTFLSIEQLNAMTHRAEG